MQPQTSNATRSRRRLANVAALLVAGLATAACASPQSSRGSGQVVPTGQTRAAVQDVYDVALTCYSLGEVSSYLGQEFRDRRLMRMGDRIMRGSRDVVFRAASVLGIPDYRVRAEREVIFEQYLVSVSSDRDPYQTIADHTRACAEIMS
ncbi:MAG: hypothetical protein AAF677_18035 [Pseudomonadota bacterium]